MSDCFLKFLNVFSLVFSFKFLLDSSIDKNKLSPDEDSFIQEKSHAFQTPEKPPSIKITRSVFQNVEVRFFIPLF
jgi:hypothetical protein